MKRFKEDRAGNKSKNHLLRKIILKYLKIAERWESLGKEWSPIELSHYYDEKKSTKINLHPFLPY